MDQEHEKSIRNFCIIAHIDHGKSTLADRFLELTGTVEKRHMRAQTLDRMDLERERGITIKMQPVRMIWKPNHAEFLIPNTQFLNKLQKLEIQDSEYILNLIDTPGHVDFSYEVSRALAAVEGAILLVDATQGVQAQTVAHLAIAQELGKTILPVINKIDVPYARIEETEAEIKALLGLPDSADASVIRVSAKTGEGVEALLEEVIKRVPAPSFTPLDNGVDGAKINTRALIFDSHFHPHSGVIAHVRVMDGTIKKGDYTTLAAEGISFVVKEVGIFVPDLKPCDQLFAGDIGYVATGIREAGKIHVGDTLFSNLASRGKQGLVEPLSGYKEPKPMIWLSIFPVSQEDFPLLRDALAKLRLNDSAVSFNEEQNEVLGKGFRCGFLGLLHSEIVIERLRREFHCELVVSLPSLAYEITRKDGTVAHIADAARFPDAHALVRVREPWLSGQIFIPDRFFTALSSLLTKRKGEMGNVETLASRLRVTFYLPLRVFVDGFFDDLKRISEGYASLFYDVASYRDAVLRRIDVVVAEERAAGLSRVVASDEVDRVARNMVERLRELLPRAQFAIKIQAVSDGRIIASATVPALRKHVTGNLYGGDRSRKMKLWKKQKEGKKRLGATGRVAIPPEVFIKMAQ
jgi:GTP-binding protein LepA